MSFQVELPVADPDAVFDPSDADHAWNAKVMLMAVPPPDDLYIKTCQMGESSKFRKQRKHSMLSSLHMVVFLQLSTTKIVWCTRLAPSSFWLG